MEQLCKSCQRQVREVLKERPADGSERETY